MVKNSEAQDIDGPLHLKKLCVGPESIAHYQGWLDERRENFIRSGEEGEPRFDVTTRNTPKRAAQILGGGSLYWIINRVIAARHRVLNISSTTKDTGQPLCLISVSLDLIPVHPMPHRPFQGWRYLENKDAPQDIAVGEDVGDALPPELQKELRKLGLI